LTVETEYHVSTLLMAIAALGLASAFFSGSETAMMALNRYRLRHLVKQGHPGARRANKLIKRPDRLLGVILIGNNLVNNTAATLAAVVGFELFGDAGLAAAPFVFTLVFLIFSEVAPKTIGAHSPERIAFPSAYILVPLLRLFYPFVALVNGLSNAVLKPFLHGHERDTADHLNMDELRTMLREGGRIPKRRQDMLLGVVDLERVTVDDIMVPRNEIVGIDIDSPMSEIVVQISASQHTRLPVFKETINNVIGILHLRRAVRFIQQEAFTKADLLQVTREPYFVPKGTPLHTQLFNFQKQKRRIALVVDEYGDIQGIVTLEDILEEIVGEFTTDFAANMPEIHPQPDGSFYIDGTALIRDVNRALGWHLPTEGPRTLNGLILEHLEFIPESNLCLQIDSYLLETLQIKDNMINNVKIQTAGD
jgi:Mg2+/Co2+ transporter CorB